MQPNEQAKRLEVILVGGDRTRGVRERLSVLAEPLVTESEDMERIGILTDVPEQLFEMADRGTIALEPEMRAPPLRSSLEAREREPSIFSRRPWFFM